MKIDKNAHMRFQIEAIFRMSPNGQWREPSKAFIRMSLWPKKDDLVFNADKTFDLSGDTLLEDISMSLDEATKSGGGWQHFEKVLRLYEKSLGEYLWKESGTEKLFDIPKLKERLRLNTHARPSLLGNPLEGYFVFDVQGVVASADELRESKENSEVFSKVLEKMRAGKQTNFDLGLGVA